MVTRVVKLRETEEPAPEMAQQVLSQSKRPEVGRFLLQVDRQTKGSYATAEVMYVPGLPSHIWIWSPTTIDVHSGRWNQRAARYRFIRTSRTLAILDISTALTSSLIHRAVCARGGKSVAALPALACRHGGTPPRPPHA
jgi:hypothetical protein